MKRSVKNLIEYAGLLISSGRRLFEKSRLVAAIKAVTTAALLLLLWFTLDRSRLEEIAHRTGFFPWALAFGLYLIGQTISTRRWQILCRALNYRIPFKTLWKYYMAGCFFNLFLPTSVGGDAVKTIMLGITTESHLEAFYTVLWDRLFGIVAITIIVLYGLTLQHTVLPQQITIIFAAVSLLFLTIYLLVPIIWQRLRALPHVSRINGSFISFWQPACFIQALIASIGFHLIWITVHLIFAKSTSMKVSFAYLTVAVPVASIISMIPITFHGIGLREGALMYILGFAGIEKEESIVLGLLSYSVMLATGVLGGVIYSFLPGKVRSLSKTGTVSGKQA